MSVLETFKRMMQEEVVEMVTIGGKISAKDKKVAHDVKTRIDDADDLLAVVDILKEDNMLDEADAFRILVEAVEEEGA